MQTSSQISEKNVGEKPRTKKQGSVKFKRKKKGASSIDVEHMSPREMESLITKLIREGKVNSDEAFRLLPIQLSDDLICKGYRVQYYSEAWDNPLEQRNMLAIFKNILEQQRINGESSQVQTWTAHGIAILERIQSGFYLISP